MIHTISIPAIGFVGSFDTDTLPASSLTFATAYGLKQWLQDGAAAPKGTSDAARLAQVKAREARLLSGTVPGVVAAPVSPVVLLARKLGLSDAEATAILEAGAAKAHKTRAAS